MPRPCFLVLTPDFPPSYGGIQLLLHRLVTEWDEVDVTVATLSCKGYHDFDRAQGFRVRRIARTKAPRVVGIAALNAYGAAWGLQANIDAVLCGHIVCSPAAAMLRRLRKIPVVQYLYAKEIDGRPRLARFAATRADRVVAISGYTRDLALALGARPQSIRLIPPGVDLPAKRVGSRAERPTIVTVSRLRDSYKGHDVILDSLPKIRAQVPNVRWLIVGDGPLRASLEAEVARRSFENAVEFTGSVSDEQRDVYLDAAWVFAMPSRTPPGSMSGEGFGIVYLEAAAHGLPVLAGNVGGALDAVLQGETGLLVDPTDPAAVADGIVRLLTDQTFAARLGATGLEHAKAFGWPFIAARVKGEVLDVVNQRGNYR